MLKEKFKQYWKKEKFRVWFVATVIALALLLLNWEPGVIRNISDYFFNVGLLYILVGATRYIRNVGLFKTFSYMAYKRRTRKTQGYDGTVIRPMSLAEYTEKYIYADIYQKDVSWPLLYGVIFLIISMLIAFVA
ncbi:MAG: DUF3899 domain-containing protein [Ruminococcaceae bacterium]|nr:DUF3899 domain-containing protein [Oscillospiraceae bacterium]